MNRGSGESFVRHVSASIASGTGDRAALRDPQGSQENKIFAPFGRGWKEGLYAPLCGEQLRSGKGEREE
jgi:hypothetical protein